MSADASHPLTGSLPIRTRPLFLPRTEVLPPQRLEEVPRPDGRDILLKVTHHNLNLIEETIRGLRSGQTPRLGLPLNGRNARRPARHPRRNAAEAELQAPRLITTHHRGRR